MARVCAPARRTRGQHCECRGYVGEAASGEALYSVNEGAPVRAPRRSWPEVAEARIWTKIGGTARFDAKFRLSGGSGRPCRRDLLPLYKRKAMLPKRFGNRIIGDPHRTSGPCFGCLPLPMRGRRDITAPSRMSLNTRPPPMSSQRASWLLLSGESPRAPSPPRHGSAMAAAIRAERSAPPPPA